MNKTHSEDRRIGKTQMSLHTALMGLMREKAYDEILVQEILDRANVGRSTFYAHFRDKDELLTRGLSHLKPLLTQGSEKAPHSRNSERIIGFSKFMLQHAFEYQHIYRSLVRGKSWGMVRQRIEDMLRDIVQVEVDRQKGRRKSGLPSDVIVQFLVTTFVSLLSLWLEKKQPITPAEADEIYRSLVLPALRTQFDP